MTALAPAPTLTSTHTRRPWRRATVVSLVLAGITVVALLTSLAIGTVDVAVFDAWAAALGIDTQSAADFIVGQVRAPRVFTAALVGVLLAASGTVLQSVVRNELASPDIVGISEGAAAAAVIFIAVTGVTSSLAIAPAAVVGALVMSGLILLLGSRGRIEPMRMIIAGIGLGFVAMATITYLLTRLPEKLVPHAYAWTVGSTNARTWQHVAIGVAAVAVTVPVLLAMTRKLRTLEMGDDLAASLGVRVRALRLGAVIFAAITAGLAAALVGPVAFIALVAPALARRLTRSGGLTVVPALLTGALLMLFADFAARELFSPTQLPVGLFTALVGAPYLIWLLARHKGAFS